MVPFLANIFGIFGVSDLRWCCVSQLNFVYVISVGVFWAVQGLVGCFKEYCFGFKSEISEFT